MKRYQSCYCIWALFLLPWLASISAGVETAHAGEVQGQVFEGQALATVAQGSRGVLVLGFEAENISALKSLSSSVNDAALDAFRLGEGALVSAKLAQQLSLHPGDVFTLTNPIGQNTFIGVTPLVIRYRVLGVVDSPLLVASEAVGIEMVYIRRTEAEKFSKSDR